MKKLVVLVIVLSLLFSMLLFSGCDENTENSDGRLSFKEFTNEDIEFENNTMYIKNQLLITAPDDYSYSNIEKDVNKYNGKIVGCIELTNDYQVEFPEADYEKLTEIKTDLSNDIAGSEITLHNVFETDTSSNYSDNYDKDFTSRDGNWWRSAIKLTDLEKKEYDYQEVKVGLYDSFFDTDNPDLNYAFSDNNTWNNDKRKLAEEAKSTLGHHGTNVSGFLSAKKGNGKGIDGVSNNVELYGYSFMGDDFAFTSTMKRKHSFALMMKKGIKVINNSTGFDSLSVAAQHGFKDAVDVLNDFEQIMGKFYRKFIDRGYEFVIVTSAGNLNNDTWIFSPEDPYGIKEYDPKNDGELTEFSQLGRTSLYTADYDCLGAIKDEKVRNRIIVVGSSNKNNKRAEHSVCGDRVDIYAPGEALTELTTGKNGDGTSYAAPIVSGVVALMWGINPGIKADDIKFLLKSSATQPIEDEKYKVMTATGDEVYMNKYLVNADNAVERAKNHDSTLTVRLGEDEGMLLGYVNKVKENGEKEKFEKPCQIMIAKGTTEDIYKDLTDPDNKDLVVYQIVDTDVWGEFDVSLPEGDYYLYASYNNKELTSFPYTFSIKEGEVCVLSDIVLTESINQYTALGLIDKPLSEIAELMGNDYTLERKDFSPGFGTGDGSITIRKESLMRGLAFYPSYESGIYQDYDNGVNVRDKIRQGSYEYKGIAVYGNGKLNDRISANMTYLELAEEIGEFGTQGAAQALVYSTEINGYTVSFYFSVNDMLNNRVKNGKVSSADMRAVNPQISSIAVFRNNTAKDTKYHNDKYGWSVEIPEGWFEFGYYQEYDEPENQNYGLIVFVHKELHEMYNLGYVMSIYAKPKNDPMYNKTNGWVGQGGFLGENQDYNFFWMRATDVQFIAPSHGSNMDDEDKRHQEEYNKLENIANTIRQSFKVDESINNSSNQNKSMEEVIFDYRNNDYLQSIYSFSGKLVSDTETTPGRTYYYILLKSPVKYKKIIGNSSSSIVTGEVDSIQLTTRSAINFNDYENMNVTVKGGNWKEGGSGGWLHKEIGVLVDEIIINEN